MFILEKFILANILNPYREQINKSNHQDQANQIT